MSNALAIFETIKKKKAIPKHMFPNLLLCGTRKRTVRSRNVTIQQRHDTCTPGGILKIETTFFTGTMLNHYQTLRRHVPKTVLSIVTALRASCHTVPNCFHSWQSSNPINSVFIVWAVRAMETLKWMSVEPSMSRCLQADVLCRVKIPTDWYSHKKVPTRKKYNN
jgi:hypothetical protein